MFKIFKDIPTTKLADVLTYSIIMQKFDYFSSVI